MAEKSLRVDEKAQSLTLCVWMGSSDLASCAQRLLVCAAGAAGAAARADPV